MSAASSSAAAWAAFLAAFLALLAALATFLALLAALLAASSVSLMRFAGVVEEELVDEELDEVVESKRVLGVKMDLLLVGGGGHTGEVFETNGGVSGACSTNEDSPVTVASES
jgi:hypothetical protein